MLRLLPLEDALNKLPDILLKFVGSKCKYKSQNIYEVLECYLKTFTDGFMKLHDILERDEFSLLDLFLDFIVLCFPESKVLEILGLMTEVPHVSSKKLDMLSKQLKMRVGSSKKSFQKFIHDNKCFQIVIMKVLQTTDCNDSEKEEKLSSVLRNLITNE